MIPLANLYYLLCYAWNLLPATHLAPTASEPLPPDANPALSLLTHLLTASLRRQPQGPQVRYHPVTSSGPTLRGRLLLDQLARDPGATIAQRLPARHDELTADTPLNRLLATALRRVQSLAELPASLRTAVRTALAPLTAVSSLPNPSAAHAQAAARALPPGSNYHLPLRAAELLLFNLLPAPPAESAAARYRFHDFTADEAQMGLLFEAFVRNFLRREQHSYAVSSDVLRWRGATATSPAALPLLPVMRTDTTLSAPHRRLVIDTKFYRQPLGGSRFAESRLLAPHLYQLLAYLRNQPPTPGQLVEGMLLYPVTTASGVLDLDYQLEGFRVLVRTLDLSKHWTQIHQNMLGLVAD